MGVRGNSRMSTCETALQYARAGISVVPVRNDGTKAAARPWKDFQQRIPTTEEIHEMFRNGCGIAAITGRVSGFLEVIDFETAAPFHEWLSLIEAQSPNLASSLVIIQTPSGGHHVVYRCPEQIEGNQKLAMRLDGSTPKVLIETRGEGGYILTVGSPANCHPTGKLYTLLQGDLVPGTGEHSIPTITAEERSLLLDAARRFNEVHRQQKTDTSTRNAPSASRPGDSFNERATWEEILEPHGWIVAGHHREETLWRRPGKTFSFSATTNYKGSGLLYVFSTNAHPFEHESSYQKFAAHALLNHDGDFAAAAKELGSRGYGEQPRSLSTPASRTSTDQPRPTKESTVEPTAGTLENAFQLPQHWKILDAANLTEWTCAPLRPIVENLIAQGNFVLVAAQSQTGKTLTMIYVARKMVQGGVPLFGKLAITPVERVAYFVLEDPDRRIQSRMLDTSHEFPETLEPGRLTFYVAPGFSLTDPAMFSWLETVISGNKYDVAFIDTYQRATPGLSSFKDEEQSEILHKLATLTRKLSTTLVVIDHVRKTDSQGKRGALSIDDIKGTGGKAQNADCVILMERTGDRSQIKLQAFSKDFDQAIGYLIKVAPAGSQEPKFQYVADLEQLGASSHERSEKRKREVLESMEPGKWLSVPQIAIGCKKSESTVQRALRALGSTPQVDEMGKGKTKRYMRVISQNETEGEMTD
jgi:putative DNA primase/helicase